MHSQYFLHSMANAKHPGAPGCLQELFAMMVVCPSFNWCELLFDQHWPGQEIPRLYQVG